MSFNTLYNTPDRQRFWAPTRLHAGLGSRELACDLLAPDRPTVLVVDAHFAEHPFVEALTRHVGAWTLQVVNQGEPYTTAAEEAVHGLEGRAWNQLLALGGGSTLDLAKALLAHRTFGAFRQVGYGALRDLPDLWPVETGCPFVAIPTTAGTGSETSRYYLLSDPASGKKLVSRSWTLCPSAALLDPFFLQEMPERLVVQGAFDAFTHLWETHFCAQEGSAQVRALAQEGMAAILGSMLDLERTGTLDDRARAGLQLASAWGGMALSNVRTGFLHTAGEALAAQVSLPHPLTLWAFFRTNMRMFQNVYDIQGRTLFHLLAPVLACRPEETLTSLQGVWERAFRRTGAEGHLRGAFRRNPPLLAPILDIVCADRVLLTKEAPRPLLEAEVRSAIEEVMADWSAPA
ncbi:MAG TPA: iron-containing alcohol dehydrogenase [Geothrix sp.]|nr:iron-containing alcohol dehydrogenase [Geothrix sp.]